MSFDIAIIGIANRFPGAPDKPAFWRLLTEGRAEFETLTTDAMRKEGAPDDLLEAENYVPVASRLPDITGFDADFFGIPNREALLLDPQHRLFLECVWEAFEDAGLDPQKEKSIGVWAGASLNSYLIRNLACDPQLLTTPGGFLSLISNEKDYLATRVAYRLNLHGPAVTVQTACSTSLVAVHLAMQSLIFGECDVAVAGGVSVKVPQDAGYLHQPGMPFSGDGTCRPFDAAGSGTVFGSGAGVVILRQLDDALAAGDDIYCVIRGSAMNNDGNRKVGFTAPSVDGQAEVIRRAVAISGCEPGTVTHVEAHGTATELGDPIEAAALAEVYAADREQPLRMGSVKSNIGHMETAAGVAGLIKTALILRHRTLVPSIGFNVPNPHIDFCEGAISIQTRTESWTGSAPLRAAVSSFGMGGTNLHMILEEPPKRPAGTETGPAPARDNELIVLSARSEAALVEAGHRLADTVETTSSAELSCLAANLRVRRAGLSHRHAFLARTLSEVVEKARRRDLEQSYFGVAAGEAAETAFIYCGGGAQYPAMCAGLMSEPVFARSLRNSMNAFGDLIGHDLQPFLDPAAADDLELAHQMQRPDIMFPALFAVQHAMGELLQSWGLTPQLVMGHSNGEYAAAVQAGVMDVDAAIRLVAARSTLMMQMPEGGMIAIAAPEEKLSDFAREHGLSIGATNAPENTALSGSRAGVSAAMATAMTRLGVEARELHVGAALHSHLTQDIAAEFAQALARESFRAPRLRWISSVTGTFMADDAAPSHDYWLAHLTSTVRFQEAAETFLSQTRRIIAFDMGPGRVAGDLLRQNAGDATLSAVQCSRSHNEATPDLQIATAALAKGWALGAEVDFRRYGGGGAVPRMDLPGYPWQRRRFWVDPPKGERRATNLEASLAEQDSVSDDQEQCERPLVTSPFVAPTTETECRLLEIWKRFLGNKHIGTADDFIELGGTSLLAIELVNAINHEFCVKLELGAFLEAMTVAATARKIDALSSATEDNLLREALAEIEGKSDDELAALLQSI